jgi:hypothetical protein
MKFKVHLFREYRETYEVEADSADAALNLVDENPPAPIQTEMLDYLSHALIDPVNEDGTVDYDNSVWLE